MSPLNGEDCFADVTYKYEIENVGSGSMDITTVERTRGGEQTSLMDLLDNSSLDPSEYTTIIEKEKINLCAAAIFRTEIIIEADPPNRIHCDDEDMYEFSIEPPLSCDVSLQMECATLGGLDCSEINAELFKTCDCADECARELVYRYTAASCVAGLDGCADSGANGLTADIVVSSDNALFFEGRVQIGDDILISNSGECLPSTLDVTVRPTAGDQPASQVVVIDSSCNGVVSLLDNFGSLKFSGYTCSDNVLHSCYIDVEYTITTSNEGTSSQTVTDWIFDLNGDFRGPGIELPFLEPGESFSMVEPAEFELCVASEYTSTTMVITTDTTGNECEDSDALSVTVPFSPPPMNSSPVEPPSSRPVSPSNPLPATPPSASAVINPPVTSPLEPSQALCEFNMDIECIPSANSQTCNATPPPVAQCTGRPFEMGFLYAGGNCTNSWNAQEAEGKFFCNDLHGGPPTKRGEKSYIVVTDLEGGTTFHSDYVEVGALYTLSDGGNRFPSDQLITIYKTNNTEDPDNVLQSVQYHSSCSSNLFLKDRFGASQLVLWVNEEQGIVSCFANQTFEIAVTIPISLQGGPATVTGLTVSSNVDPFFFNLTGSVAGIEAGGGDTIRATISVPVDLSEKRTYDFFYYVNSNDKRWGDMHCNRTDQFYSRLPSAAHFPYIFAVPKSAGFALDRWELSKRPRRSST